MINGRFAASGICRAFTIASALCSGLLVLHRQDAVASPVIPVLTDYEATYPALSTDEIIRQAVDGNVLAQHELSNRFVQGRGVPRNVSSAAYWFALATARGFPGTPSLDTLKTVPIFARTASPGNLADLPSARLAITPDSTALTATLDASTSTAAASVHRYVWSVQKADGSRASVSIGDVKTTQISLPEFGIYYVTVTVLDATGRIDYVTEKLDLSAPAEPDIPATPALLSPIAGSNIDYNVSVEFEWSTVPEAANYEFDLFVGDNLLVDPITSGATPSSTCINDVCTVSVLFDFEAFGTYTWRVSAGNEAGTSEWASSEVIALAPLPPTPTNNTPIANTALNAGEVATFVWEQDNTADAYDFHIFNQSNTSQLFSYITNLQPEDVCVDSLCSLDVVLDIPVNTGHAWRVRAKNAAGISSWSRTTFNVIEPITEPPEIPISLAPIAGGIVETNTEAEFSWAPAALATAYEVEIMGDTTLSASVNANTCTANVCSLSVDLEFPADNEYAWRVRSINPIGTSEWTDAAFYAIEAALVKPATPVNVSPAVGADVVENQLATFTWEHDPLVAVYDFHFFNNEPGDDRGALPFILGLSPLEICSDGVCNYETLVNLPIYAQHAWRVRASNSKGSSDWSRSIFNAVELITEPPLAPQAVSPLPNALLETDTSVAFTWNTSATASRYELQLIDSANAALDAPTAYVPAANCTTDTCSISVDLDLPIAQTYQWQVRAENAAGMSNWTATNFEIIAKATTQPPIPTPLNPETDALISQLDATDFVWSRDPHAVTYEFFFFDAVNSVELEATVGLRPDDICTLDQCVLTLPMDLPVGANHAWRVRGRNSLGASNWSRETFEVIDSVTASPGVFELTSPIDNTEIEEDTEVTFLWTRASQATSFEFAFVDGTDPGAPIDPVTVNASTCDVDFCSLTTTPALPVSDLHSWQVRAINTLGSTDWVSAPFALVSEPVELAAAPVIISPLAGKPVITGQEVAFQWEQDADVVSYEYYLTDADTGPQHVVDNLLPADVCVDDICTYTQVVSLLPSALHSWHARARYLDTDSEWSSTALTVISDADEPIASLIIAGYEADATGLAPLALTFDPSGSTDEGDIVSFEWDFGDGSATETNSTADTIDHTFLTPGTYSVELTVTNDATLSSTASVFVTVLNPATTVTEAEASRLLAQATFGPTRSSILEVQTLGIEAWLDEQFSLQGAPHLDYVSQHSNGSNRAPRHEIWWSDVVRGEDQLRQRVAFALSQIFVVSDTGYTLSNEQYGVTAYYDMLRDNAFGNYRDLLEDVTLSPVMGLYLSMLQNAKNNPAASTRADENYAREVLQLFSIGLHELNLNGTTDGSPVFTQDQIEAFARVFTGWNYADAGQWNRAPFTGADLISPMRPFESFHDVDPKVLLSTDAPGDIESVSAGITARIELGYALDNIFNHQNVGPFISKQLIMRLVTSNPSPAYVQRVAGVFNTDGSGERGNLQAVVRAILLDDEARTIPAFSAYGKLREPVLRLSHLWRAFNFNVAPPTSSSRINYNTGSPQLENLDSVTGQAVLKSPSVFNFFQPSFTPAGPVASFTARKLVAPEFEIFTESNELATTNRIGSQIQTRSYMGSIDGANQPLSTLDFSFERSLAADTDVLLDHLDTLLLSGNMSANLRQTLTSHLNALPDTESGLSQRVRDVVTLIMASPDYLVQM